MLLLYLSVFCVESQSIYFFKQYFIFIFFFTQTLGRASLQPAAVPYPQGSGLLSLVSKSCGLGSRQQGGGLTNDIVQASGL